jgi:hypothetical protein
MWCCTNDGGSGPSGAALWGEASNRPLLRWLMTVVVSDEERRRLPDRLEEIFVHGPDVDRLIAVGRLHVDGRDVRLEEVSEPCAAQRIAA